MSKDAIDDGMEEVISGWWAKFVTAWDSAHGIFTGFHIKEANGQFSEQIVAEFDTPNGIVYVGLPSKNPRNSNSIQSLKIGHRACITLIGFYNQDKWEVVDQPGKTKLGMSFAKNYSFRQSKLPDPSFNKLQPITVDDFDSRFD